MEYLVFETETQATQVERAIFQVGAGLAAERGHFVDENGIASFGADGKPAINSTRTTAWAKPKQRKDGKWVVLHPKHSRIIQSEPELLSRLAGQIAGMVVETFADDWFDTSEV